MGFYIAACVGLLALSACEIPTEAPHWDSRWIVPTQTTEIALDEFLPAGVTVTPDGSSFSISVAGFSGSRSLAQLCSPCSYADGQTMPKPAFSGTFPVSGGLPAQVVSAELAEGRFEVELTNGFSFDPVRPGGNSTGQLTVRIFNVWDDGDTEEIGIVLVDGADTAFPAGTSIVRELILTPGPISTSLRAEISLASPSGDDVEINTAEPFGARFDVVALRVSSIEVDVSGRRVELDEVALDLENLDDDLVERVTSGGFVLEIENPFGVALDLSFQIAGDGIPTVEKSLSISPEPSSSGSVSLTGDELRSFLGRSGVTLSGEAVVSPTAPTATVRPGQVFSLDTKVDVSVRMGAGA